MTFHDAHELGFFDNQKNYFVNDLCAATRCTLVDNSADDILDITRDVFDRLDGVPVSSAAAELQEFYVKNFLPSSVNGPDGALLGPRFALKYCDLIS